jgi:hypothetical protein
MRVLLFALVLLAFASVTAAQQSTPLPPVVDTVPTPSSLGPPLYLSGVGATPLSENVNIRLGPGLDYPIINRLEFGDSIDVVGHNGYDMTRDCDEPFLTTLDMWIQVQFQERRGWIARCVVDVVGDVSRLLEQPAP